jgi:hypothetical protein
LIESGIQKEEEEEDENAEIVLKEDESTIHQSDSELAYKDCIDSLTELPSCVSKPVESSEQNNGFSIAEENHSES